VLDETTMRGFTLVEFFLILIIILFILALLLPLGFNFYKGQQLQICSQQILQALRQAQSKAMGIEADSNFGVYFDNANQKYILFKGSSYVPGDPDNEEFDLPSIITVTGASGVVFSKLKGIPNFIGDITIRNNDSIKTININEIGRINLEP